MASEDKLKFMQYRKEIDGLRALAVVPVVLFHAGFGVFSGGYVGVDVFFVISGYLITSIIQRELNEKKFSIIDFYERRARRILPALFLVIFASILFAWLRLMPNEMKDFSQSLLAVATFSSNFLFWRESGYFDSTAELKPLLHTWSLAVEEQYYLVFPPLMMLAWRRGRNWTIATLATIFVASFAAAQWASFAEPTAAFYLLPTRGWELLMGAFAAFYRRSHLESELRWKLSEVGAWLGLSMILYSMFTYTKETPFPGVYALVPTAGAVLIILFATQETIVGRLLGAPMLTRIGLLSYSAYLWHQPIFAFARQTSIVEPDQYVFFALSIFTFALAFLTWRYVEVPLRKKTIISRKQLFVGSFVGTVVVAGFGLLGHASDGFRNRFDIPHSVYESSRRAATTNDCSNNTGVNSKSSDAWYCLIGVNSDNVDFLIFGDSHALSALPAVKTVATDLKINGVFVATAGCAPFLGVYALNSDKLSQKCSDDNKRIHRLISEKRIPLVILIARWTYYTDGGYSGKDFSYLALQEGGKKDKETSRNAFREGLSITLKAYEAIGARVVLVLQVPQQLSDPLEIYARASSIREGDVRDLSISKAEHTELQQYVREIIQRSGVETIELDEIFCDSSRCPVGDNIHSYYYDDDHLSTEGSKKLVAPLEKLLGAGNLAVQ